MDDFDGCKEGFSIVGTFEKCNVGRGVCERLGGIDCDGIVLDNIDGFALGMEDCDGFALDNIDGSALGIEEKDGLCENEGCQEGRNEGLRVKRAVGLKLTEGMNETEGDGVGQLCPKTTFSTV